MARPTILGPQEHHEKTGADLHRDTRRPGVRWREKLRSNTTCAGLLAGAAATLAFVPASVEFVFPPALLYFGAVMLGRVRLPMHLPMSSMLKDPNNRDEKGRLQDAQGADYLGPQLGTNAQVWHGLEDIPQHVSVPGTTGAGKTEALKSIALTNALAQGSGLLYVDGKGQTKLYAEIMAEARKAGREDDVQLINFLTANGSDSFRLAPFAKARANMIREILVGQLNEPGHEGNSSMFFGRVVGFLGILAPILEWLRTERGVPTTLERVRDLTELANVVRIATKRQVKLTDSKTGAVEVLDLHDLPNEYVQGLRDYLGQTGGYDLDQPLEKQRSNTPSEQHSYVAMQLTEVFSQWLMTYGHIFRTDSGDIDMRDVVLNRRILVCILPVLEGSEKTTSALGKIIVAMLRSTMALSLGSRVEGQYDEIIANQSTEALASFRVVFDELVYYATNGMDSMAAMARSLRMQFLFGFQEAAGLKARLGDKLWSLLGNANLQIIMRLQEGGETRSYVENSTGKMQVTQSTSFENLSDYSNATVSSNHSEVREINRVNWGDVRKLKPGEAIIVFGSRLVHARIFRTVTDATGLVRRNRPNVLAPPNAGKLAEQGRKMAETRKALLNGGGTVDAAEFTPSPALQQLLGAFGSALKAGIPPIEAGELAVRALPPDTPASPSPPAVEGDALQENPEHAFSALLRTAAEQPSIMDIPPTADRIDTDALKILSDIERVSVTSIAAARTAARSALSLHASAMKEPAPNRLPAVPAEYLIELIDGLTAAVEGAHTPPHTAPYRSPTEPAFA